MISSFCFPTEDIISDYISPSMLACIFQAEPCFIFGPPFKCLCVISLSSFICSSSSHMYIFLNFSLYINGFKTLLHTFPSLACSWLALFAVCRHRIKEDKFTGNLKRSPGLFPCSTIASGLPKLFIANFCLVSALKSPKLRVRNFSVQCILPC